MDNDSTLRYCIARYSENAELALFLTLNKLKRVKPKRPDAAKGHKFTASPLAGPAEATVLMSAAFRSISSTLSARP